MIKIGDRIRTKCGSSKNPVWIYGTVTATHKDDPNLYRVEWGGGGYDYLYDFEMEVI